MGGERGVHRDRGTGRIGNRRVRRGLRVGRARAVLHGDRRVRVRVRGGRRAQRQRRQHRGGEPLLPAGLGAARRAAQLPVDVRGVPARRHGDGRVDAVQLPRADAAHRARRDVGARGTARSRLVCLRPADRFLPWPTRRTRRSWWTRRPRCASGSRPTSRSTRRGPPMSRRSPSSARDDAGRATASSTTHRRSARPSATCSTTTSPRRRRRSPGRWWRATCCARSTAGTRSARMTVPRSSSYDLTIDLAVPLPGMLKRRAAGRIIAAALADLKRVAEGAGARSNPGRRGRRRTAAPRAGAAPGADRRAGRRGRPRCAMRRSRRPTRCSTWRGRSSTRPNVPGTPRRPSRPTTRERRDHDDERGEHRAHRAHAPGTTTFGVDLGGTHVRIGRVDDAGRVIEKVRANTPATLDGIIDTITDAVAKLRATRRAPTNGDRRARHRRGRHGGSRRRHPLLTERAGLHRRAGEGTPGGALALPVAVDNDANVAALAEVVHGARAATVRRW